MNKIWQMQEAKTHLEAIAEQAIHFGAQVIQTQDEVKVVLLSIEAYQKLTKPDTLVGFFQKSPLYGVPLDLERNSDTGRDVDL